MRVCVCVELCWLLHVFSVGSMSVDIHRFIGFSFLLGSEWGVSGALGF